MELFQTLNHRKILKDLVAKSLNAKGYRLTFSDLAQTIGVQKTYVSRVMAEQACWNADQAFQIGEFFKLSSDEATYYALLVEMERTGLGKRRAQLLEKVKHLRQIHLRSEKSVQQATQIAAPTQSSTTAEYFSDPYHSIVHVYLSLPKFRKNMSRLAEELGLSLSYLKGILRRLESLNVLRYDSKNDVVTLTEARIHSPGGSPLVFGQQLLFRALAMDRMQRCPAARRNNFNVVFTADPSVQESIWGEFLEFLKKVEELANTSTAKEIFYLQFDLFPWTSDKTSESV